MLTIIEADADLDAACLTRSNLLAEIARAEPSARPALLDDLADLDRAIADVVMTHMMHPQPESDSIATLPGHARR